MNNFAVIMELLNIGGVPIGQIITRAVIYQGDSLKLKCWARDLAGRVINLSYYTTTAYVGLVSLGVTPITNVAGEFDVELTAVQSQALTEGLNDIKFKFTHSSGPVTKVTCKSALDIHAA